MSFILFIFILSFGLSNQINNIPQNIETLSKMNGDSFIDNIISKDHHDNYYRLALIQYPGQISSGQLSYGDKYKSYYIQSNFLNINYGKLSNDSGNSFTANEYMIQLSIAREYRNDLIVGSEVGYSKSKIREYINQNIIHSIGVRKSFSKDKIIIGLTLENMIHSIQEYSNISIKHEPYKKISFQLKPNHINSEFSMHYTSYNHTSSEIIISASNYIGDHIHFMAGKSLHLSNSSFISTDTFFENLSMGMGVSSNSYKIDLGFQYLGDFGIIIGTSLLINIK